MKRIMVLMANAIICLVACNNDNEINQVVKEQPVNITLRMPDAERVNVYSTATTNECYIEKLWVLEFNTAGTLVNNTLIDGKNITRNGEAFQILPELPFVPTLGYKVVCIANSDVTSSLPPNVTYSTINDKFPTNGGGKGYFVGGEYLPMYGEFTWLATEYECPMTRAVAKIQVQLGENYTDVTASFNAENVTYWLADGGDGGSIQPQATITGTPLPQPTPTKQYYFTTDFNLMQKSGATAQNTTVYVYEYPTSSKDGFGNIPGGNATNAKKIFSPDRQHIMLKKTIGSNRHYYRLDFYDAINKEFIDTKRNHHYLFTIKNIRSEGHLCTGTIQDLEITPAWKTPGSNIEYTVTVDGISQNITSNGQYAIVTSVDTIFIKTLGSPQLVCNVRYLLSDEMAASAATYKTMFENPTNNSPFLNTVSVSNGLTVNSPSIQASTSSAGSITDSDSPVRITAATGFTEGTITFQLGNIKHVVPVKYKP